MSPDLLRRIEKARNHAMTPEEWDAQAISFTHHNLALSGVHVSKGKLRETLERLKTEGVLASRPKEATA